MIASVLRVFVSALVVLAASGAACAQHTPFIQNTDRRMTRVVVFGRKGVEAQCAISYGVPQWKEAHAAALKESEGRDLRWRLGSDLWTTLDTNVPLVSRGTKVRAGHYCVVLERTARGRFQLVLLDSDKVRKRKLDASMAAGTDGGIGLRLEHERTQEVTRRLAIELHQDEGETKELTLHVRWGPHHLSAPVALRF